MNQIVEFFLVEFFIDIKLINIFTYVLIVAISSCTQMSQCNGQKFFGLLFLIQIFKTNSYPINS